MRFNKANILFVVAAFGGIFFSCTNSASDTETDKKDTLVTHLDVSRFDINQMDHTPGIAGVFEVPEMLSLCRLDSAKMTDVSAKVLEGFRILEKDMNEIGAELNGPQGMIYYNNDPNNFKFETVFLIKNMPAKTPKNCQIVILEAGYMIVYNYEGPYEGVSKSYEVIRKYMDHNNYIPSGPAREFYPDAPAANSDPSKLLTTILVPVVKKKG